jgi:protein CpxP
MKSIRNITPIGAIILTFAGILLTASISEARPFGRPGGEGHEDRPIIKMMKELNLSDAQKEQIKALMAQAREKTRPQRELVQQERKKLRELMLADNPDANAIRSQTQKLAGYEAELNVVRAEERKKIEAVLTPEQRAQWKKNREKRHEKMKAMRE